MVLALLLRSTVGWTTSPLARLPPPRLRAACLASDALGVSAERTLEPGTVYVVATPIGNLEDLTLRRCLSLVSSVMACLE